MPNPFMRSVQQNTSDESMTPDRPHPTDPILETYEGSNHPYRGIEQHGIPDTGGPSDPVREFSDGTRKVIYDEPPKEIDPVPVRVIQQGDEEIRSWRVITDKVPALNGVRRVLGQNKKRTKIRIKNNNNFFLYIGTNESIASYTGYPMGAFESLELDIQEEVWVMNPDAALLADIVVIEFFSIPVDTGE
jgi:hypothetical protein